MTAVPTTPSKNSPTSLQTIRASKVINLSRNFGKEIATTAGISKSTGDAVIIMDADGQHPPKIMTQFIDKWLAGAQVVVEEEYERAIKKKGSLKKSDQNCFTGS